MVREIRVHDYDEVARYELEAVDVGCSQAQLAGARFENDVGVVGFGELVRYGLGAVWGAVVDDDEFPVEISA